MKNIFFLMFTTCTFYLSSCSPDNPGSPTSGAVTVKYEIKFTSPISSPVAGLCPVFYTNSTGQQEMENVLATDDTFWTKTIISTKHPLPLKLFAGDGNRSVFLRSPGSGTTNIYVDNVLKATATNASFTTSGFNNLIIPYIYYTVP